MRWNVLALLLGIVCLCSCRQAKKKDSPDTPDTFPTPQTTQHTPPPKPSPQPQAKSDLVALDRFWDDKAQEHVYTYGDVELAAWRKNPSFREEGVIGYVSRTPKPQETVRLYRAVCKDGRHSFSHSIAPQGNDITRVEDFEVYAWNRGGDGRVQMNACHLAGGKDTYFSLDYEDVMRYAKTAAHAPSNIIKGMFYVYPTDKTATASGAPK